jgi:hypothetical protein
MGDDALEHNSVNVAQLEETKRAEKRNIGGLVWRSSTKGGAITNDPASPLVSQGQSKFQNVVIRTLFP